MRLVNCILGLVMCASVAFAQSGREYRRSSYLRGNSVKTVFGNWGVIGQPAQKGLRGAWIYDNNGYIGDFSIMIGAEIVKGDTVFHSVEVCPVQRPTFANEVSPAGEQWGFEPLSDWLDSDQKWVAMSDAPSTWPESWSEWPYDTEGALEAIFAMDDDNDEEFNYSRYNTWGVSLKPDSNDPGRNGLGLRVECRYRQFLSGCLSQDALFMDYTITNEGTTPYEKIVFGGLNGTFVGCTAYNDQGEEYDDDVALFDIENNATLFWDFDGDASRNPLWTGEPGYAAIVVVQSPGNSHDGIDNDRDNGKLTGSSAPFFDASDFDSTVVHQGDQIVLIDEDFNRTVAIVPDHNTTFHTRGLDVTVSPGLTKLAEGNILEEDEAFLNSNAYDGVDNDLDGLIDENFYLHYRQIQKDELGNTLIDRLTPTQYIAYISGLGASDPLIDEEGDNVDEVGLTSFENLGPSSFISMADDEEQWGRLTPGFFSVPPSIVNNEPVCGEDGDYIFGSGYFSLYPGESKKVILALVFANTREELQTRTRALNVIDFDRPGCAGLTITAPVSGEYSGNSLDITWDCSGGQGVLILEWTRDFGRSCQVLDYADASQEHYSWDISDVPDGVFNMVCLSQYSPYSVSCSEQFTINSPSPACPQVMFDYEIGGYVSGDLDLSWTAGDADGDSVLISLYYSTTTGDTIWHFLDSYEQSGNVQTTHVVIDTKKLPNSNRALLKVNIMDGSCLNTGITGPFVTDNTPPTYRLAYHFAGNGTGTVGVSIWDSSAVTGHQYKISFDAGYPCTEDSDKSFKVVDVNTGETVLSDGRDLNCSAESETFDGVRLRVCDDPCDLDTLWWSDPTKAYGIGFARMDVQFGPPIGHIVGVRQPSDYEIQFFDEIVDTTIDHTDAIPSAYFPPATPVNFKVYNATDKKYIDFVLMETTAHVGRISRLDELIFVEPLLDDSLVFTWDTYFSSEPGVEYDLGFGDTLFLRLSKPFCQGDMFSFSTSSCSVGDVNNDATINVLDVLSVVNDILGTVPLDANGKCRADCNGDAAVNVLDALGVVNVILGVWPICPGGGVKVDIYPETLEFLKSLELYLSPENFAKFMSLVQSVGVPIEYQLSQNYPNPFNPITTIQYQIPVDCRVSLTIYNVLGQKVRSLIDRQHNPGYYTAHWDSRNEDGASVSSGVYFCRIEAGEFTRTMKMLLLR